MNEVIHPPRTALEVFQMLPEGTLAEVIDNQLYMSPAPTPFHQLISMELSTALNIYIRAMKMGKLVASPIDLYLTDDAQVVQPDILFMKSTNPIQISTDGLHGVPDLIIEILSPGNKHHDLVRKKLLYEQAGVAEYWTVDPESGVADGWQLVDHVYVSLGQFKDRIVSITLNNQSFSWL